MSREGVEFRVQNTANGLVRITISEDAEKAAIYELPAVDAVKVAGSILDAAIKSSVQSGKKLPDAATDPMETYLLFPTSYGVTPLQNGSHKALTFGCGEGAIGFSLQNEVLREIGELLAVPPQAI